VDDALCVFLTKLHQCRCEIRGEGRGATLVVDDRDGGPGGSELENGRGKALAPVSEKPGGADDGNVGQEIEQAFFGSSLSFSVDADGMAGIAGFVGRKLEAIEDVVGAQKHEARTGGACGLCHIGGTVAIDGEREIAVRFAAINVGVGGGKDNPIGTGILNQLTNAGMVAQVGILDGERCEFGLLECRNQIMAEQA